MRAYIYIKVYQIYIYQSWVFSDTRLSNNLTNLANYKRSCNYLMTVSYQIIKYSGIWRDMILVNIQCNTNNLSCTVKCSENHSVSFYAVCCDQSIFPEVCSTQHVTCAKEFLATWHWIQKCCGQPVIHVQDVVKKPVTWAQHVSEQLAIQARSVQTSPPWTYKRLPCCD